MYHLNISSSNAIVIPTQREASSIPKLLTRVEPYRHEPNNTFLGNSPCLQYARKQFSNAKPENIVSPHLNSSVGLVKGIDTASMNTFRWAFLAPRHVLGKGIAELSRVEYDDVREYRNPHFPLGKNTKHCTINYFFYQDDKSPLVIHHYPASWSEMMARKNIPSAVRDNKKDIKKYGDPGNVTGYLGYRYKQESKTTNKMDQDIQEWLLGFIDFVGQEEAERLLQDVGQPEKAKRDATIVWGGLTVP